MGWISGIAAMLSVWAVIETWWIGIDPVTPLAIHVVSRIFRLGLHD
jgi:hypothetical protein